MSDMDVKKRRAKLEELRQKRHKLAEQSTTREDDGGSGNGLAAGGGKGEIIRRLIRKRLSERSGEGRSGAGLGGGGERLRGRQEGEGARGKFPLLRRVLAQRLEGGGAAALGAQEGGQALRSRDLSPENARKLKERLQSRKQKLEERLAELEQAERSAGDGAGDASESDEVEDQGPVAKAAKDAKASQKTS
jgi:hypothetical protein